MKHPLASRPSTFVLLVLVKRNKTVWNEIALQEALRDMCLMKDSNINPIDYLNVTYV